MAIYSARQIFQPTVEPSIPSAQPIPASVSTLSSALHAHDLATYAHSQRVIHYALTLGRLLGLSQAELLTLEHGVFLHDIGKLHIPNTILKKSSRLSKTEWEAVQQHPLDGYDMVGTLPSFEEAAETILYHHEWYNGSGYPYGLKGENIPLGARICSLVDTLDALTSHRPYRNPISFAEAFIWIESERGTHFDPFLVDTFTAIRSSEWQRIQVMFSRSASYTYLQQS